MINKARILSVTGILKDKDILRAMARGLVVASGIYILILLSLLIRSDAIYNNIEATLPQRIVPVSAPNILASEKAAEDYKRPALGEQTAQGLLPAINEDGLSYFKAFRHEFMLPHGNPTISILLTGLHDLGAENKSLLDNLPPEIGVILSAYQNNLSTMEKRLRADKREIWLQLPMERHKADESYIDPGPKAILSRRPLVDNKEMMHWTMSRAQNYIGLATYSSDVFAKNQPVMRAMLKDIFDRGLGLLELNPDGLTYFEQNAAFFNAPYIRTDIDVSNEQWLTRRKDAFIQAEARARETGHSLLLLPFYPNAINDLKLWLRGLESNGFILVPSSAIAAKGIAPDTLHKPSR